MGQASIFDQVLDPANRANPYPLYAELRKTPVTRTDDGMYVVSTYDEIVALMHDPRVSSDPDNIPEDVGGGPASQDRASGLPLSFIRRDPPDHDRLRAMAMRHFGPPHTPRRIDDMRPWLAEIASGLIDNFDGKNQVDIVEEFAYPLPVNAICKVLGVPLEDQPRFREWANAIIESIDPNTGTLQERTRRNQAVNAELAEYFNALADAHASKPGDDMISGLVTDPGPDGPMSRGDLLATASLLLIAGHETTVNLIANGMLTLLRHPDVLDRLRREPTVIIGLVEELLRYEPPVQMLLHRGALADIDIAGTTIAAGAPLRLVIAAGNRDPNRFSEPDRFDPDRANNQHLAFASGIHICFGAALARVEALVALPALARRLVNPRLVADPPPYRPNPVLRGPRHLEVEYETVAAADEKVRAVSPGPST